MNRKIIACLCAFAAAPALAENLSGAEEFVCAVSRVSLCVETGECFDVQPWEIDMPEFVVIDAKRKTIATTRASGQRRSTGIANFLRDGGVVYAQGMESGRAFSLVIDETTGIVTAAIARDGLSVSAFGACTDANVRPAD